MNFGENGAGILRGDFNGGAKTCTTGSHYNDVKLMYHAWTSDPIKSPRKHSLASMYFEKMNENVASSRPQSSAG
jgi:hypothetical protein